MRRDSLFILLLFGLLPCSAQQIMYTTMKSLLEQKGDTVTTLTVEQRTPQQIYLMGGNDFHVEATDNKGLSKYLKSRCYGVRIDTALYVNCRRIHYSRYRFGHWYAPAKYINGQVFFRAVPLGHVATRTLMPEDEAKLGGRVGDAIQSSGLVHERVYYVINPENNKAVFVGKERMHALLEGRPELQEALMQEESESADVIEKYLLQLERK